MFFSDFALKSIEKANKTKSIFYKRKFIRQFVNMYSERVFISRIVFNRRHIYNHWKAYLLFWGIFIWVNMERLTVDSLKSKFMDPEILRIYGAIWFDTDDILRWFPLPNKVHDKVNHTRPRCIYAPSTNLTSATSTKILKPSDLSNLTLLSKRSVSCS